MVLSYFSMNSKISLSLSLSYLNIHITLSKLSLCLYKLSL